MLTPAFYHQWLRVTPEVLRGDRLATQLKATLGRPELLLPYLMLLLRPRKNSFSHAAKQLC